MTLPERIALAILLLQAVGALVACGLLDRPRTPNRKSG